MILQVLLSPLRRAGIGAAAVFAGSLLCVLGFGGCTAGDPVEADHTAMLPEDQRVSNVPWNKPQGWENQSQLGALANDPRIGGGQTNAQRY